MYNLKSLAAKKLWRNPSYRRKMAKRKPVSFWKGKKLSEAHKLAISTGGEGRRFSKRHRKLIGEANSRRVWSDKSRKKASRATKKTMKSNVRRWISGSANRGKSTWNKGKHWPPGTLKKIFSKAATHPNGLEKAFIKILKSLEIKYKFNTPIDKYAPDFIVESKSGRKFIFETDGLYWHQSKRKSRIRDRGLKKLGYQVVHFLEKEVKKSPTIVASKIIELLGK